MTVLPTEVAVLAEALVELPDTEPEARQLLEAGLVRSLHLSAYEESIRDGLTETLAQFEQRTGVAR